MFHELQAVTGMDPAPQFPPKHQEHPKGCVGQSEARTSVFMGTSESENSVGWIWIKAFTKLVCVKLVKMLSSCSFGTSWGAQPEGGAGTALNTGSSFSREVRMCLSYSIN